ncbi:hypothetical protein SAMN05216569_2906 [Pseudoxanthomonas sp. CF125]|nr:hypothetical protein SAMN05216569_2906 [Pseudoxanthomonas sp. CF125]
MEEQDGKPQALSPGILRLIDVLADELVADYLKEEQEKAKLRPHGFIDALDPASAEYCSGESPPSE